MVQTKDDYASIFTGKHSLRIVHSDTYEWNTGFRSKQFLHSISEKYGPPIELGRHSLSMLFFLPHLQQFTGVILYRFNRKQQLICQKHYQQKNSTNDPPK